MFISHTPRGFRGWETDRLQEEEEQKNWTRNRLHKGPSSLSLLFFLFFFLYFKVCNPRVRGVHLVISRLFTTGPPISIEKRLLWFVHTARRKIQYNNIKVVLYDSIYNIVLTGSTIESSQNDDDESIIVKDSQKKKNNIKQLYLPYLLLAPCIGNDQWCYNRTI